MFWMAGLRLLAQARQTYPGPLAEGPHTLTVAATDAAGNTDTLPGDVLLGPSIRRRPDTVIDSMPSNPTNQLSATFAFHAAEPTSTTQCQLDGGGYSACTSPKDLRGTSERRQPQLRCSRGGPGGQHRHPGFTSPGRWILTAPDTTDRHEA